jgi:high-affinity iron transporter
VIPSFLLSLREGIEAALIVGIVLGTLRKLGHSEMTRTVWGGVISGIVVSFLVAAVLISVSASFEGTAEEIFEGVTMILAAGVLTWMIFWMRGQSHKIKDDVASDVKRATIQGGTLALFTLAFLAVVREGVELALFLTATTMAMEASQILLGAALGLGVAILLGWILFMTTLRLNLSRFFQVTGVLLIIFAAGLVAHGVHEFNEAGIISPIIEHVWDINHVLDENSTIGEMLKALFGYNGNPSLTEVISYISYFGIIIVVLQWNALTSFTGVPKKME